MKKTTKAQRVATIIADDIQEAFEWEATYSSSSSIIGHSAIQHPRQRYVVTHRNRHGDCWFDASNGLRGGYLPASIIAGDINRGDAKACTLVTEEVAS